MLADALGITRAGIVAFVGAGGKTSLIQSLSAVKGQYPVVVTSTTKMFYQQVAHFPLVVEAEYAAGVKAVRQLLQKQPFAAWFLRQEGQKVIGLPAEWVDELAAAKPAALLLVEADGAKHMLIKAPSELEPVMPLSTVKTIGVLNMSVLEQPLSPVNAHRVELVSRIINKQPGELVSWIDIARLAAHPRGIFQYARGRKILVLSGGESPGARVAARQIAGYCKLADCGIDRIVLTTGYGSAIEANEVYVL